MALNPHFFLTGKECSSPPSLGPSQHKELRPNLLALGWMEPSFISSALTGRNQAETGTAGGCWTCFPEVSWGMYKPRECHSLWPLISACPSQLVTRSPGPGASGGNGLQPAHKPLRQARQVNPCSKPLCCRPPSSVDCCPHYGGLLPTQLPQATGVLASCSQACSCGGNPGHVTPMPPLGEHQSHHWGPTQSAFARARAWRGAHTRTHIPQCSLNGWQLTHWSETGVPDSDGPVL